MIRSTIIHRIVIVELKNFRRFYNLNKDLFDC